MSFQSSAFEYDNTVILGDSFWKIQLFTDSATEMTPRQAIAFIALLLTVQAAVNQPGNNETVASAGFGSNLISGLNRLVSKITNRKGASTNDTDPGSNVTDTRSNVTGLQRSVVCPPPRPDLQVISMTQNVPFRIKL
jgi:hypothetical protein